MRVAGHQGRLSSGSPPAPPTAYPLLACYIGYTLITLVPRYHSLWIIPLHAAALIRSILDLAWMLFVRSATTRTAALGCQFDLELRLIVVTPAAAFTTGPAVGSFAVPSDGRHSSSALRWSRACAASPRSVGVTAAPSCRHAALRDSSVKEFGSWKAIPCNCSACCKN